MPSGGPWRPESVTKADFDPLWAGWYEPYWQHGYGSVDSYMRRLSADASAPGFTAWRIRGPVGPAYYRVEVPSCDDATTVELPTAAGNAGFRPGQYASIGQLRTGAVILGSPPTGLIGASGFGLQVFDAGAFDELGVISCDPGSLEAGLTDVVLTLTGQGFREAPLDVFTAALYDGDEASPAFGTYVADPWVTLHDPTWEDSGTVTVLCDTSADTPDGWAVTIAYRRG